ncbi:MAG TPA: type II toxin-antitoxin system VapC family toxin [bacterium]|nr:type II toxin-antitoxin system VapC family toxin [bacterium]
MYLFDTDTISNLIRPTPSPALIRRLAAVPPDRQFTTAITVGELAYGAYRSNRPEYFLQRLDEQVFGDVTVVPFDADAARIYGRVRVTLECEGASLNEPDLRIAAIALARSLTLVTGNTRYFARVPGLSVENWLVEPPV